MSHQDIFENRKQFQLERLILFSDAVFAIAITLLVLDVRIPQADWSNRITLNQFNEYILAILPNAMGFVFSFFIIGFNWTLHHRIFGHVINFDAKLIWLNILMLFFIVLLPFTTTLTEYGYINEAFAFYWINVGLISFILFFIQLHISNPNKKLSAGYEDKNVRRHALSRSIFIALIFFIGAAFCFSSNSFLLALSRYIYVFVFPLMIVLKKIFKIKTQPHINTN